MTQEEMLNKEAEFKKQQLTIPDPYDGVRCPCGGRGYMQLLKTVM